MKPITLILSAILSLVSTISMGNNGHGIIIVPFVEHHFHEENGKKGEFKPCGKEVGEVVISWSKSNKLSIHQKSISAFQTYIYTGKSNDVDMYEVDYILVPDGTSFYLGMMYIDDQGNVTEADGGEIVTEEAVSSLKDQLVIAAHCSK